MTNRVYTLLTIIFVGLGWSGNAQNIDDALRYSTLTPQSTARVAGVAGSFGAMGGDLGVITINPAGIAGFVKSEFSFTPSLTSTNTESFLLEDPTSVIDRSQSNFGISNIGAVWTSSPTASSWTRSNFTIGFHKLADLNRSFAYVGDSQGSYSQSLEEIPFAIMGTGYQNATLDKRDVVSQKGYVSELNFGWAGTLDHKLDIGLSIGIPFVSFDEERSYTEEDAAGAVDVFNRYDRNDYLSTSGAGINFKAGLIYKGMKLLRLGASIHSPNYYTLTDDFGFDDEYTFDDGVTDALASDNTFKYKLKTPWRVNGSMGMLYSIGKVKGFANADIEFLDYSSSNFDLGAYSSDPDDVLYGEELNEELTTQLQSTVNFRLGTELAYDKLRLRLGSGLIQSPYSIDESTYEKLYSFGVGLREDRFFLDFAYTRQTDERGYTSYQPLDEGNVPLANVHTRKGIMQLTAGFKF